jgi:hypothetical protein
MPRRNDEPAAVMIAGLGQSIEHVDNPAAVDADKRLR